MAEFIFLQKKSKMKNFHKLLVLLFLIPAQWSLAQVSGISYTISPSVEYTFWDDQAGLEDGFLLGGKLGIGFGEFIELRGVYLQSLNQKTDFSNFGIPNYSDSLFNASEVALSRLGGEMKINLSRGKLLPFLTVGTGIQSIQREDDPTNKHIYINLGAGVVMSVADRYTLTLEGKNTPYNFNSARSLLSASDKAAFGLNDGNTLVNQLKNNWSINASMQFYLGGRRPGTLTDLDRAYMSTFSDGLRGLRIPIEPTIAKINFNNNLPYKDTWMAGGYAGLDFNSYVGVRGFYMQSMVDNKLSTEFDDLAMYGGEMRFKLNASRGLTPFISIGGGNIEVKNSYVSSDTVTTANDQPFASGGLGLNIPLSKRFNIFGAYRAILTSGSRVENLQTSDEIQTSGMWSAGVRLIIGKKANAEEIYTSNVRSEVNSALQIQQEENDRKAAELKTQFETRIVELETQLNEAYANQDIEEAATLMKEKEEAEQVVEELEKREEKIKVVQEEAQEPENILAEIKASDAEIARAQGMTVVPNTGRIQMSAAEFENLIEEILENMDPIAAPAPSYYGYDLGSRNVPSADVDQRLTQIEQALMRMSQSNTEEIIIEKQLVETKEEALTRKDLAEFSTQLLVELQKLNQQVEANNQDLEMMKQEVYGKNAERKIEKAVAKAEEEQAELEEQLAKKAAKAAKKANKKNK